MVCIWPSNKKNISANNKETFCCDCLRGLTILVMFVTIADREGTDETVPKEKPDLGSQCYHFVWLIIISLILTQEVLCFIRIFGL